MKRTVDEVYTYDYLPGKRFFICKDFENDGLHFRQPWVMAVEEEVERLKQRVHDHDKLLRECEALKVCLCSHHRLEGWESGWLILSDSTEFVNFIAPLIWRRTRISGRLLKCLCQSHKIDQLVSRLLRRAGKRQKPRKDKEFSQLEGLMEMKKQISRQSLLERLLAKPEPLDEMESDLKNKMLWSTRDEVPGCQEYKRRGHGLSTSFTGSCMFFLADVNQDNTFTGVVFISSIPLLLVDRINLSNTKDHKLTSINIQEEGHTRLWNDYFSDNPTFLPHLFRRRFPMNKPVFMRLVNCLSETFPFFQHRRYAIGRLGLSPLQKCTAALRMLAYGCAADAVDEYLRLGTLNDINVLNRSPVFDDIFEGRVPRVQYQVNGHHYGLPYYLTDGIYPRWSTFIQSISNPQSPEEQLFAKVQESTRKDVERAFGVLQARFAIVKNPTILWDKRQIGMIMRTCIILHNMIVENERNGYTQCDISEFEEGESSRTSEVDMSYARKPSNLRAMLEIRSQVRDQHIHEQLKFDLIQNIWNKFGNDENV
uniref:DDE Tnp4 domain-containing protein n=1 Tax=Brassica oleracea var. oleracea TaxID=109376 RepID=A0A0D3CEV7_BRAOL